MSPGALDHEWKTTSCNRFLLVLFSASKAAKDYDWMTHFAKGANMERFVRINVMKVRSSCMCDFVVWHNFMTLIAKLRSHTSAQLPNLHLKPAFLSTFILYYLELKIAWRAERPRRS